jgi:hypothetical protein
LGVRVFGSGFRVQDSGFGLRPPIDITRHTASTALATTCSGFRVQGLGFRVWSLGLDIQGVEFTGLPLRKEGSGIKVWRSDLRFKVKGSRFGVWATGFRV